MGENIRPVYGNIWITSKCVAGGNEEDKIVTGRN